MAVRGKLDLRGLERYMELLAEAGEDVDAAAQRALEAGAHVALEGMLARVPRDTENLANHLEASAPQRDGNYHFIYVGLSKRADATTARYAVVQEYGTSKRPARKYIRGTFDEDKRKINAAMKAALKEAGKI